MKWSLALGIFLAAHLPVSGQELPPYQMLDVTKQAPTRTDGQVLKARPAAPGVWPSTFVFKTASGDGCTSTAVGASVILTAAHCVPDSQSARIHLDADRSFPLVCNHHPKYNDDPSIDFALCLLDGTLPSSDFGSGFERINTDPDLVRAGSIMLLGYGCTTNTGDRDFGNLYNEFAEIKNSTPGYIHTQGGAALCFGDSGGGWFWIRSSDEITGVRKLVGVNSQGDVHDNSYLSNTAIPIFIDWARNWRIDSSVAICGIRGSEDNCRSGD
jgi:hypothetical protein